MGIFSNAPADAPQWGRIIVLGIPAVHHHGLVKAQAGAFGLRNSLSLSGNRSFAVVNTSDSSDARTGLPLTLHLA